MIKAVFFDVGGVLVQDTSGLVRRRLSRILRIDIPREVLFGRDWRFLLLGKISASEFCRRVFKKFGREHMRRNVPSTVFQNQLLRPVHETLHIARRLRAKGYTVGAISNTSREHTRNFRAVIDPYASFFPLLLSHRVHSMKPERKIFAAARLRASVLFREMVFFDDRQGNVKAAKKLGIKAFVYKNPAQVVRSLRQLGVKI